MRPSLNISQFLFVFPSSINNISASSKYCHQNSIVSSSFDKIHPARLAYLPIFGREIIYLFLCIRKLGEILSFFGIRNFVKNVQLVCGNKQRRNVLFNRIIFFFFSQFLHDACTVFPGYSDLINDRGDLN